MTFSKAFALSAMVLAVGCTEQRAERVYKERDAFEAGTAMASRLAAPPPVNRTKVPKAGAWVAEAYEIALSELTSYRIKGPADLALILGKSPVAEAYDRFAADPGDHQVAVTAATAIGKAVGADYVLLQSLDDLSQEGIGYGTFPAVRASYRVYLITADTGKIVWAHGYTTKVEPRTDEAEPAIRWALLQTERDLVAQIPWHKDR